ncbi:protein of unknown function [Pseudodesulfovibrio profundus]|uniref:Uncharacterized protein n=2 Tax=Pseudodesulfovibrio profundus TaxID=57320 RepID=A0A2C8F5P4_9BACT|nr:protein of unknown function [Pseudodesulfovibrio profundus]
MGLIGTSEPWLAVSNRRLNRFRDMRREVPACHQGRHWEQTNALKVGTPLTREHHPLRDLI